MPRIFKQAAACLLVLSLLLALVACNKTEYTDSANIVEASDLATLMQDPAAVVIDARTADDYAKGHLQGAIHLPPERLSVAEPVPGLIAPAGQVAAELGEMGISNTSKVYVYDNNGGVYAGRIWWVLKVFGHASVKVVNNGEAAIVAAGLPLSADIPAVTPATYTPGNLDESLYASKDEVKAAIEGTSPAVIIDVRSAAEYAEGAIPTALLYPHTKNLYTDGTFKSSRDTWLNYHDIGLERDDAIILYCKTYFRATQTLLVLQEAGFTNVQIYDGAWVEWSASETVTETPADAPVPTVQSAS
jgi:thiosulfate/3-mercaptopyruvate sulfurtransferase